VYSEGWPSNGGRINKRSKQEEKAMKKVDRSKKSGFTLIEIIAVLLILAVLAAVAIPRYLNLINDANQKAVDGALAAAYSQLSLTYAQLTLQLGTPPTAAAVQAAVQSPAGDFGYEFAVAGDDVQVTATRGAASKVGLWEVP